MAALGFGAALSIAQELSRPSADALYVAQRVDPSSPPGLRIQVGLPVLLPASAGSGAPAYGVDAGSRDAAALGVTGLKLDLGRGPYDPATLPSLATTAIANSWPALQTQLTGLMRSVGANFAFFSFAQRVAVTTSARPYYLTFSATIDGAGRSLRASPQLRASAPVYVYVGYTPLRASSEVPLGWTYADAGALRWQLLDAGLRPVGRATVIPTGGAFDEPEGVDGSQSVAPQAGLTCLVDRRRPACPASAPTDVRSLIAAAGAAGALVDYRRRIRPLCVAQPDGSCNRAVQAISVSTRTLSYGSHGCVLYRNAGSASQTLEAAAERYWVDPRDDTARPLATGRELIATGARAYDRQVVLPAAGAATIAGTMLVNPVGDQPALVPIDGTGGALQRLAPLHTNSASMAPCS